MRDAKPTKALLLLLLFAFASKRAVAQATQIATSGGRAKGMRREVTGMDARQALRPQGRGLQRVLQGACP